MTQMTMQQAFELALEHHQAGRLREAQAVCRQILAQQPQHAQTLHLLGVMAHQAGRNDLAVDFIRQTIALNANFPEAHNTLGIALRDLGKLDEAIAAHRQAIALNPGFAQAHSHLGIALSARGELEAAVAAFRQALALKPDYPEAHSNLGVCLRDQGKLDEAIAACRQAIALKPNYPRAFYNLGNALRDQRQLDEAIVAYRKALALNPNLVEAHTNLGHALNEKGLLEEAIGAYRQAIAVQPGLSVAHSNLAMALIAKGEFDEAIAAFRQAIALDPHDPKAHSDLLSALNYHPGDGAPLIAEELIRWNRQHAEPLKKFIRPFANDPSPERPLRIGYVSTDFCRHASAFFLEPLLEHHDPHQVVVHCYAQVPRPDDITRRLQERVAHWRSTVGLSEEQVAGQIRDDRIDLLIDLKLHTSRNRLLIFARKPAPVQVTWLGYPGSTGLGTIDYRLSDPYLDPPGIDESIYAEQTMRLPDTFWCYDPLDGRDIPVNPLPALTHGVFTFGCLNTFHKVNDAVLRLWTRILQSVPGSRIVLLSPEGPPRRHTLELLAQGGIAPGRVEFASFQPRQEYLQLYHRMDLALDTFFCNGHTTSLDSFWMGVPVVTLVGTTPLGRAGLSQAMNLNLPELVASSPEEYVQIAANLAHDLPRLARLRATLRQRMERSPLMDAPLFARHMEAAYRTMWRRWCTTTAASP